jgi:hypothetical protein
MGDDSNADTGSNELLLSQMPKSNVDGMITHNVICNVNMLFFVLYKLLVNCTYFNRSVEREQQPCTG